MRLCFGKMKWNRVFFSETGGKLRLCFGKMIWNRVFFSETGGKLRLCFGKTIWNRVFDIEKSRLMTVFIRIFIKKDLDIEFKSVLFWESSFSYCIISYYIVLILNHILSVACTDFVILPMLDGSSLYFMWKY